MSEAPLHSFAICAYGESPYLRECVESVLGQDLAGSEVLIATSTPSDWLEEIACKFDIPVFVNAGEHGIGQDWNFAYSCASGKYVTIAHQDDVYCAGYAREAVAMLERTESSLMFFSNYGELRDGVRVDSNGILKVKRRMLRPLEDARRASSIRVRRRAISLGNPICCPAVTLNASNVPERPFRTNMKCNLDWDTWEVLSKRQGEFFYSPKILMYHRIHEESTTTSLIEDNTRSSEDLEMFERFWPKPVAHAVGRIYARSERSNELEG